MPALRLLTADQNETRAQTLTLFTRKPTSLLTGLVGGGVLNFDGIDVSNFSAGDRMVFTINGSEYAYTLTTSSATEAAPAIVAPDTGGPTLRWVLDNILANAVITVNNILAFGADPTGVSDSHAAIQSAVTATEAAGGGYIIVPGGLFLNSAKISISALKNLHVIGVGWGHNDVGGVGGSCIKSTFVGPVFEVGVTSEERTCDVQFRNFRIDGATLATIGISVLHTHNWTVRGVRIERTTVAALNLNQAYSNRIVENYINNNSGSGIIADEHNDFTNIVGANKFLSNTGKGVWFTNGDSSGSTIDDNDFEGNGIGIQLDAGSSAQSENFKVTNNFLETQSGKNLRVGTDASAYFYDALIVVGNKFGAGTGTAASNAVDLDRCRRPVVFGNTFSLSNLTATANTAGAFYGPNTYNTSTFPTNIDGVNLSHTSGFILQADAAGVVNIGTGADWPFGIKINGTRRARIGDSGDLYGLVFDAPSPLANIKGISSSTILTKNLGGVATLSGGLYDVVFDTVEADGNYRVILTPVNVNETIYVAGGQSSTGFRILSSNGASTASVNWLIFR